MPSPKFMLNVLALVTELEASFLGYCKGLQMSRIAKN